MKHECRAMHNAQRSFDVGMGVPAVGGRRRSRSHVQNAIGGEMVARYSFLGAHPPVLSQANDRTRTTPAFTMLADLHACSGQMVH
jgi:hypothetical protein